MEDDKNLYKRFLKGDKQSFEIIVDKYMEKLIYFIYGFVKRIDIAEDLAQDVFVHILMNKGEYNSKYSLKTYLYIIAKSKAINYVNREKRVSYLQDNEFIFSEKEIEDIVFNKEDSKKVKEAINSLPDPQSQIIYLADIEEFSYKEICKVLDISLSQVKSLLHRGRKKIKNMLAREVNFYNE